MDISGWQSTWHWLLLIVFSCENWHFSGSLYSKKFESVSWTRGIRSGSDHKSNLPSVGCELSAYSVVKALHHYPDLPSRTLPFGWPGALRWCLPWPRSQSHWYVVWSQEFISSPATACFCPLSWDLLGIFWSLVLSDLRVGPGAIVTLLHLYFPCQHLPPGPSDWRPRRNQQQEELVLLSWDNSSPAGEKGPFSGTVRTWGPCCCCWSPATSSAGGWRLDKPKKRRKEDYFTPLCLFLLSEPLLEGSSWGSGHISAHSCLGSLSSAQWTLKKKRDQEVSAGLMVPQNLVHFPTHPSLFTCQDLTPLLQALCPWSITSFCGTDTQSVLAPYYPEPELQLVFTFEFLSFIKCVLMSWKNIDSSFMMWLVSCPHIAECATHLSHRLCYGCDSFESLTNLQRKLWWDHFY